MAKVTGEIVQSPDGRWRGGDNGNASGRIAKAWTPEMREAMHQARKLSVAAVRKLAELMDCGDPRIELKASELLIVRVFGAPKPIETDEDNSRNVSLDELPARERLALLEDAAENVARALEVERSKLTHGN